ncbi:hypothetical protein IWW54_006422 [Coemansia sp. RSA 2705]|nr:hypothetical protein IWW54_006422 [Coemansia sp. RSA 2705]
MAQLVERQISHATLVAKPVAHAWPAGHTAAGPSAGCDLRDDCWSACTVAEQQPVPAACADERGRARRLGRRARKHMSGALHRVRSGWGHFVGSLLQPRASGLLLASPRFF